MLKNHWNKLIICLSGQTPKQPLSNFEPWESCKNNKLEGWGLTLFAYKKGYSARAQQIIKTFQSCHFHDRIVDECFCIARNRETAKICLFGQTPKQLLSKPWKSWKNNKFQGWGLTLFNYKKGILLKSNKLSKHSKFVNFTIE